MVQESTFPLRRHDFYFFIGQAREARVSSLGVLRRAQPRRGGSDPPKNPRSVVLTAWHYGRRERFDRRTYKIRAFHELSELAFDQIPCGSNISCRENIDWEHLLGFLMTTWQPTIPVCGERLMEAIEEVCALAGRNL